MCVCASSCGCAQRLCWAAVNILFQEQRAHVRQEAFNLAGGPQEHGRTADA